MSHSALWKPRMPKNELGFAFWLQYARNNAGTFLRNVTKTLFVYTMLVHFRHIQGGPDSNGLWKIEYYSPWSCPDNVVAAGATVTVSAAASVEYDAAIVCGAGAGRGVAAAR